MKSGHAADIIEGPPLTLTGHRGSKRDSDCCVIYSSSEPAHQRCRSLDALTATDYVERNFYRLLLGSATARAARPALLDRREGGRAGRRARWSRSLFSRLHVLQMAAKLRHY